MRKEVTKVHIASFLRNYLSGSSCLALEELFPSPLMSFTKIVPEDPEHFYALNFADALIHIGQSQIQETRTLFVDSIVPYPAPKIILREMEEATALIASQKKIKDLFNEGYFKHLEREALQVYMLLQSFKPMHENAIKLMLRDLPEERADKIYRQVRWISHIYQARKRLGSIFRDIDLLEHSFYPMRYRDDGSLKQQIEKELSHLKYDETPVFFLSSYDLDLPEILEPFRNRSTFFVFQNIHQFYHCLESKELMNFLYRPQSRLLILNEHPQSQLQAQEPCVGEKLHPIRCIPQQMTLAEKSHLICELLEKGAYTDLYHLGRLIQEKELHLRLGPSHALSIQVNENDLSWQSKHKELPSPEISKLFDNDSFAKERILKTHPIYPLRPKKKNSPLKVAHITPQMIDGNHSPSLLLRSMIHHGDQEAFEFMVFSTERMGLRAKEYPMKHFVSASSYERAPGTMSTLENQNHECYIINPNEKSLDETAKQIAIMLSAKDVDIAFFHSFDVINMTIARYCDVPLKIGFSHSDLPQYPGMDAFIACEEGSLKNKKLYESLGMKTKVFEYAIDVRQGWGAVPYPMSYFEQKDGARLLTTVSNHLETRVSSEMVRAISQILKDNPDTFYMPIGMMKNKEEFCDRFAKYGVHKRVIPMGMQQNPSQLMRSMHLYLNEFPFGGCASILDAMAASCPIVSMHDEDGPPQARHAGVFYGLDRVIKKNDVEGYIALANKLLSDNELYDEWASESVQRYENRTKPKDYVKGIEHFMLECYQEKELIRS